MRGSLRYGGAIDEDAVSLVKDFVGNMTLFIGRQSGK
jgi:hypothetical protein